MNDPKRAQPAGFALGTAQLGMAYGRVNEQGHLSDEVAAEIVRTALAQGVRMLDTARAYGDSERRIGNVLGSANPLDVAVTTKVGPFGEYGDDAHAIRAAVRRDVESSMRRLGMFHLYGIILHEPADYRRAGGAAFDELVALRDAGLVDHVGVSINSPDEALSLAADSTIDALQLPMNLLDNRWRAALNSMNNPRPVTFVRSALLQGILASEPEKWPKLQGLDAFGAASKLRDLAATLGRDGIDDLCVAFVRGLSWVHWVVIGVETLGQLSRNLDLFTRPALSSSEISYVQTHLPSFPVDLLMPWKWPKP